MHCGRETIPSDVATTVMPILNIQEITDKLPTDAWSFIGKVINKTKVQNLSGRNGKYFYFEVVDTTSKIKCWVYNEEIPAFYSHLKINSFYKIQNVWVKKKTNVPTNLTYQHTCHIIFQNETVMHKMDDLIRSLEIVNKVETETTIGPLVFGIITMIGDFQNLKSTFDKKILKVREIIITDKSRTNIQINIWDEDSVHFLGQVGDVIQIKNGVKFNDIVSIYNFEINSKSQQTRLLKIWYEDYKHRSVTYNGPCNEEDLCACARIFQLTRQFKGTLRSLSLEDIHRQRISISRCLLKPYEEIQHLDQEKLKLDLKKLDLKIMSQMTNEELDTLLLVRGRNRRLQKLTEVIKSQNLSKE
ncbi:Nucleic acid-binding, OB-fold,Replication protein A, OB domain [Cinara cedri]|uniref:Nucleic acid-binding, OB-fold,Replication protein A, OB domain n=1 Tax=Cinara cedri TaxID=506608 RepID=A0A5E4NQ00_9HEMI|nr:Nucleic acid-binding, OB-fold,Replication protein A, OB domain [Cinara cedri]